MEELGPVAIIVPVVSIVALFIVLPAMVLNYLSKRREAAAPDPAMNASLLTLAEKLERRLDAIETILDHEVPGWRRDVHRRSS